MKTKVTIFTTLCLLLLIACKSYQPFSSKEDKKMSIKLIKDKINLSTKEYDIIKKNDSALYAISNAIKGNVKSSLVERRIDSFVAKKYTLNELSSILQLDSLFPNLRFPMELDRRKLNRRLNFDDLNKLKKYMTGGGLTKDIDSLFQNKIIIKDSIKQKKKQQ